MTRTLSASLVLLLVSAGSPEAQNDETSTELVKVAARTLDKTVSVPSDLLPFQSVAIHAKVSGFLESIDVDRGSWVRAGQRLAVISAPELEAGTVEAEARL